MSYLNANVRAAMKVRKYTSAIGHSPWEPEDTLLDLAFRYQLRLFRAGHRDAGNRFEGDAQEVGRPLPRNPEARLYQNKFGSCQGPP